MAFASSRLPAVALAVVVSLRAELKQYRRRCHGCFAGSSGIRKPFSQAVEAILLSSTFVLSLAVFTPLVERAVWWLCASKVIFSDFRAVRL